MCDSRLGDGVECRVVIELVADLRIIPSGPSPYRQPSDLTHDLNRFRLRLDFRHSNHDALLASTTRREGFAAKPANSYPKPNKALVVVADGSRSGGGFRALVAE